MSSRLRRSRGRPPQKRGKRPTIRRKDLPVVRLPGQTRSQGGKTKLTNHRAAIILHAISCGCYRETAAELAGIKAETLSHWMGWTGEPYETFQNLVRKAEASLANPAWSTSLRGRPKSDQNWRSPSSSESFRSDGRRSQWSRHRLSISTSTWPTSFRRFRNASPNSTLKANSRLQQSSTPP
jgi:hypothetical protein